MSCMMDEGGTLTDTFFVLPVCWVSVNETAIVASERRSNSLKQKNGATVSRIICLSVRLNHADKAELSSGPAGHCSLIIYWYVHRVMSWRRAQYYTVLKAVHIKWIMGSMRTQLFQMSSMIDARPTQTTYTIQPYKYLIAQVCNSWITVPTIIITQWLAYISHKNLIVSLCITTISNPNPQAQEQGKEVVHHFNTAYFHLSLFTCFLTCWCLGNPWKWLHYWSPLTVQFWHPWAARWYVSTS